MEQKDNFLIYDIECTGHLGYTYGMYEANMHKVVEQPILLSFSYVWYAPDGENKIITRRLSDYDTYEVDRKNDYLLTKDLHALFNQADITLGHNSKQFDDKMARMFFLKHDMLPPSPTKSIDTKTAAKAIGRFGANTLNNLSDFFGFGQKTETTHADLWWTCLYGPLEEAAVAWEKMLVYNEQDVALTIQLYEKLRPWILNHPNMARINGDPEACPNCQVPDKMQRRGFRMTNVGKFRRYQCQECGHWCSRRMQVDKDTDVKPTYVNFPN